MGNDKPYRQGELQNDPETMPETQLSGGVHVGLLLNGGGEAITKAVESICRETKPLSKKFIMREANNLSPKTPLENIGAMYAAVKKFGKYGN